MLYQAILLCAAIAYVEVMRQDFSTRRIPNLLSAIIIVLAALRMIVAGNIAGNLWSFGLAITIFLIAAFLFARGFIGGGDVKLIAATVLLIGYQDTYRFLVLMALVGGILSLGMLIWHWMRRPKTKRWATVPYGIPISVSALLVLLMQYYQG